MAARGGERPGGRRCIAAIAVALFVLAYAIYQMSPVSHLYNTSDPLLIVPTSLSLLRDGDLDLSEFGDAIDPNFWAVIFLDGRPYNRYPIGTSLIILPLVWYAGHWPAFARPTPMEAALSIAAFSAKVLAALSVALLFLLLLALTGRPALALTLALVFAFATVHYPIHGGGLWTHNAVIPLVLVALLLLTVRDGRWTWCAAFPLAMAFATRPTSAPLIACLTVYVARWRREALARYALVIAALAILFLAWSLYTYGALLPPYYLGHDKLGPYRMSPGLFGQALAGHLVSPNRGLFVFMPISIFSVWGMACAFRSGDVHAPLYRTLSVSVIVHWVMISLMARKWWAGWSFGPRHLAEITPLLILLLVPATDGFAGLSRRAQTLVGGMAAVALAWSLFVAVHGATSRAPHDDWNGKPLNVDQHPERLWDWRDMQILRGVIPR